MQRSASKKRTDPFKNIGFVRINALFHKKLRFPLDVILERMRMDILPVQSIFRFIHSGMIPLKR